MHKHVHRAYIHAIRYTYISSYDVCPHKLQSSKHRYRMQQFLLLLSSLKIRFKLLIFCVKSISTIAIQYIIILISYSNDVHWCSVCSRMCLYGLHVYMNVINLLLCAYIFIEHTGPLYTMCWSLNACKQNRRINKNGWRCGASLGRLKKETKLKSKHMHSTSNNIHT